MSKHTPGPWFVRETGDHYSKRNDIYVIGNPDGSLGGDRKLALMIDTWAEEQTIHNARLIAAAPELLEACESAINNYSAYLFDSTGKHEDDTLRLLKAAVIKATGE